MLTQEVTIDYAGDKYDVQFVFNKGKGFFNYDDPIDEDEVIIEVITPIDDAEELDINDLSIRWDLEELIKQKI